MTVTWEIRPVTEGAMTSAAVIVAATQAPPGETAAASKGMPSSSSGGFSHSSVDKRDEQESHLSVQYKQGPLLQRQSSRSRSYNLSHYIPLKEESGHADMSDIASGAHTTEEEEEEEKSRSSISHDDDSAVKSSRSHGIEPACSTKSMSSNSSSDNSDSDSGRISPPSEGRSVDCYVIDVSDTSRNTPMNSFTSTCERRPDDDHDSSRKRDSSRRVGSNTAARSSADDSSTSSTGTKREGYQRNLGSFSSLSSVSADERRRGDEEAGTNSSRIYKRGWYIKRVASLQGHVGCVWNIAWRPDGLLLASCGSDRRICLWGSAGIVLDKQQQHQETVGERKNAACTAAASLLSLKCHSKRRSRLKHDAWQLLGIVDTAAAHARTVRCVSWSPDGTVLAAASFDATVSLWHVSPRRFRNSSSSSTSPETATAHISAGPADATETSGGSTKTDDKGTTASRNNTREDVQEEEGVHCISLFRFKRMQVLEGHEHECPWRVRRKFAEDVHRVTHQQKTLQLQYILYATCEEVPASRERDSADAAESLAEEEQRTQLQDVAQLQQQIRQVKCVAWSHTGRFLATCSRDKSVWIFEKGEEELDEPSGVYQWKSHASPNEREHQYTRQKHQYELGSSEEESERDNAASPITSYKQSCGGRMRKEEEEHERDEDFYVAAVLQGHTQDVKAVRWHPSEDICVSASYDDTFRVWGLLHGEEGEWGLLQVVRAHQSTIWCVAFDHLGSRLVSCSDDRSLKIWSCIGNGMYRPSRRHLQQQRRRRAATVAMQSLSAAAPDTCGATTAAEQGEEVAAAAATAAEEEEAGVCVGNISIGDASVAAADFRVVATAEGKATISQNTAAAGGGEATGGETAGTGEEEEAAEENRKAIILLTSVGEESLLGDQREEARGDNITTTAANDTPVASAADTAADTAAEIDKEKRLATVERIQVAATTTATATEITRPAWRSSACAVPPWYIAPLFSAALQSTGDPSLLFTSVQYINSSSSTNSSSTESSSTSGSSGTCSSGSRRSDIARGENSSIKVVASGSSVASSVRSRCMSSKITENSIIEMSMSRDIKKKIGTGDPPQGNGREEKEDEKRLQHAAQKQQHERAAELQQQKKQEEEAQQAAADNEERELQHINNWKPLFVFPTTIHTRPVYYVDWEQENDIIVTACGDNALRFFAVDPDSEDWALQLVHTDPEPQESRLCTLVDQAVQTPSKAEFLQADAHNSDINCAVWNPCLPSPTCSRDESAENILASVGDDGRVNIWKVGFPS